MTFAEVTTPSQVDSHTYSIDFSPLWVIGTVPHGGYVTACFLAVVRRHFDTTLRKQKQPHTITLHLDFLRRTQIGPANFKVKDVKLGLRTSIVHVTLAQDGREEVVGYITNSNMGTETGVTFPSSWNPRPQPLSVKDFSALEAGQDPFWGERNEWPVSNFRKAPRHLRTWFPRRGQPSPTQLDMWYCFRDPASRFTNESLGFLCDAFPQILEYFLLGGVDSYSLEWERTYSQAEQSRIMSERAKMWYPTVLLNLDIKKALPEEGVKWMFIRVEMKQVKNGRYDLEVLALDEQGDLVAVSNHVCFAVSADRNTATRRKAGEGEMKL